jgi:hypothetical protein
VCVREKESETLSVRQTGKPTDCYRQALARNRWVASEEGKGKEGEDKRGKVFGHGSSMDEDDKEQGHARGLWCKAPCCQGGHGGVGCSRPAMLLLYMAKDEGLRLHTSDR